MQRVKEERTGWRDLRLSERHRLWGWDCPMLDLDFIAVEYDAGEPKALVEYKHEQAKACVSTHPSYRALVKLGNRAELPVFAVRYAEDFSWWRVTPLNELAKSHIPEQIEMGEFDWVRTLYRIRGREVPDDLLDAIAEAVEI